MNLLPVSFRSSTSPYLCDFLPAKINGSSLFMTWTRFNNVIKWNTFAVCEDVLTCSCYYIYEEDLKPDAKNYYITFKKELLWQFTHSFMKYLCNHLSCNKKGIIFLQFLCTSEYDHLFMTLGTYPVIEQHRLFRK